MSDLLHFIHGLNIFNLTKGQAPDEINTIDYTPTNIANARLDAINRNANQDMFEELVEEASKAKRERRQVMTAAVRVVADRKALHETYNFIHEKLDRGVPYKEAFAQADEYRQKRYQQLLIEKAQIYDGALTALSNLAGDAQKIDQCLMEMKIKGGRSNRPGLAPDR